MLHDVSGALMRYSLVKDLENSRLDQLTGIVTLANFIPNLASSTDRRVTLGAPDYF